MAYNLGTVRDSLRNLLDDDDYEQEFLDRAINYAQWDITNRHVLSILEKSAPLVLGASAYEVALPTDHHETQYLLTPTANITKYFLDYTDFLDAYPGQATNQASAPYYWSEYGRKLQFSSPADQAYSLTIKYQRSSPKLVSDADVPDIPEEFEELLVLGAYMRILKREDDRDEKSKEAVDYAKLLTDFLHVYGRKKHPGGNRRMRVA